MLNILLTGIGGQGTVLAAKLLAQAAMQKGWEVRTAETIGMAQRGGSVVSHVRIGTKGETIYDPLIARGTADLIVAFEPAEAARVLPYLKEEGILVTATSAVQPVTSTLSGANYDSQAILAFLAEAVSTLVTVDDKELCEHAGGRKTLNTILLAQALEVAGAIDGGGFGINVDDLKKAIKVGVKEQYVDMNLAAIDISLAANMNRESLVSADTQGANELRENFHEND